jgi:hypothetical protein
MREKSEFSPNDSSAAQRSKSDEPSAGRAKTALMIQSALRFHFSGCLLGTTWS